MNWSLLLSFLLTVVIVVGFQFFTYRRRLRARVMQQLELMARAELEKRLQERLGAQLGLATTPATPTTGAATVGTRPESGA